MEIKAMVVREKHGRCSCDEVDLDQPRDDEIIVRVVATGICHSDISVIGQIYPFPLPIVVGHEGAGIVERVGRNVTYVRAGDKVVMSSNSCGACHNCVTDHSAYCKLFVPGAVIRTGGSPSAH